MREEMRRNKVKQMLKAGKPVVGTFMVSRSVAALEVLAVAGFDFVIIDAEHFMKNPETIEHLIIASEAAGITPFVRVQENVYLIDRVLSAGARGVMVPMVNTREMAQAVVDVARYSPIGKRGVCNPRAVSYGVKGLEDMKAYYREENEDIMILAQIETAEGVKNFPEIVKVKGIDTFFIGPMDLSHSLGITGEFDNPLLKEHIDKVFELGKKANIPIGIMAFNAEETNEYIKKGFDLIAMGCDMMFLAQSAMEEMAKIKR
ncbi:4-hydroxy-2-oxovalerate aldolase [Candidatus Aerophobetes bacterium]|nr:4-hydroxy-2-oxovalerate aldolase [Candidatus Aerophobetes bacterium]